VDVVNTARRQHERQVARLTIDPELILDSETEERQVDQPAEAA
jgi:hypothetical protein